MKIIFLDIDGVLNTSNSPQNCTAGSDVIYSYIIDNCLYDEYCLIPMTIVINSSGGNVEVSNLNVSQNVTVLNINSSVVEDASNITIDIDTSQGRLVLRNLKIDFRGSKNLTLVTDYDTYQLNILYSKHNETFPFGIRELLFFVEDINQKELDPWGQTIGDIANWSTPIYNVTSLAYEDSMNIYAFNNRSIHPCVTIYGANNFEFNDTFVLNMTTNRTDEEGNLTFMIENLAAEAEEKIYLRINLTNCPWNATIDPVLKFNSWCSDCVWGD